MSRVYRPLAMAVAMLTASTALAGVSVSYNSGSPWSPAVGELKGLGTYSVADEPNANPPLQFVAGSIYATSKAPNQPGPFITITNVYVTQDKTNKKWEIDTKHASGTYELRVTLPYEQITLGKNPKRESFETTALSNITVK